MKGFTAFLAAVHPLKAEQLPTLDPEMPLAPGEFAELPEYGRSERIENYILYDTAELRAGHVTHMFQDPRCKHRDITETNMQLPGMLPMPHRFIFRDVSVALFAPDLLGSKYIEPAWRSIVTLHIGGCGKAYLQCPAFVLASAFCFLSGSLDADRRGEHRPQIIQLLQRQEYFGVEVAAPADINPGITAAVAIRGDYIRTVL